jgi:RNase P/RNase MRP subunit p29
VSQAAKVVPMTEAGLRHWIAEGRLKTVRIAGRVFVSVPELRERFGDDIDDAVLRRVVTRQ